MMDLGVIVAQLGHCLQADEGSMNCFVQEVRNMCLGLANC